MRTPKQSQLVPNAPAGPPFTPQFPRQSCKSPGNALHWSLQATLAPPALPQLDTLRPMKTVCPSCQCPPTLPSAPPRSLPSLVASVLCPHFTQNRFFVRLRSSQIVSDRLRSSQIVRAHRRPPPFVPAELPQCSPDSARQTGKNARHFALFRVIWRQNTPADAREEKGFLRDLLEIADISKYWPTNVAIYNIPAFSSDVGPPDSWREDRRASRSRKLCPSQESDELQFRQMSTSTRNQKPTKHPPPERKKYRDIWGHLGTFGDICPPFTPE